jgi:hypothetical protein
MRNPCIIVLTARGVERLLQDGGSQAWRLNPENAKRVKYCVCVQNRHNGHWGGADQEHGLAFIVGRISDVIASPERDGRYLITFSKYARINSPNAWKGGRNPVRYGTLEDFGIAAPNSLAWQSMPKIISQDSKIVNENGRNPEPLTIEKAKAGLSRNFGVPESAIEISIKF